jgi:amidophosphoribosyltransferase
MCGIFGVYGHPEASNIAYLGLHALQHRGQESAGIVASDGEQLRMHRAMGLVQAGFSEANLARLQGHLAIGHVRYSTAGHSHIRNAQPLAVDYHAGSLAIAHNGNLTNHASLRAALEKQGSIFQTGADTEAIVHLIAASKSETLVERIVDALQQVQGAYSLLFATEDCLVAARDPSGFRPLCLGILPPQSGANNKPAYVVSSEPAGFDLIGAELLRDIAPGEILVIDRAGPHPPLSPLEKKPRHLCIFEHVYFSRPDSRMEGADVYEVRKSCGARLFEEYPVAEATADDTVVIPVPDSGVVAAIGLSQAAGLPFELGLIRSHYVGRTFIEPAQSIRHFGVRLKLNPNSAVLKGKRVIVVDDSIVRGTTSRKLVGMLRGAGAKEVHVRISSPPTAWPCFYGIDTPTRSELIAASHTPEEICRYLRADSLGYLSLEGLIEAVSAVEGKHRRAQAVEAGKSQGPGKLHLPVVAADGGNNATTGSDLGYCHACFSGQYPVRFQDRDSAPPRRVLDHGR